MRRFLATVVALTALAAACGSTSTTATDGAAAGDDAPEVAGNASWPHDFVATTIDGATIDAGDYEGQDLVLWFWAPW